MIRRPRIAPCELAVAFRLQRPTTEHSRLYATADTLLSLWDQHLGHAPLTWLTTACHVPTPTDSGWDALVIEIKARIRRRGDSTATAGYAGGAHILLTDEELSRELRWARRNQWRAGVEDVFGVACDVLVPPIPGPVRWLSRAAHAARFRWLGLPGRREAVPLTGVSTFSHAQAADLPSVTRQRTAPSPDALATEITACVSERAIGSLRGQVTAREPNQPPTTRAGANAGSGVHGGRSMLVLQEGDDGKLADIVAALALIVASGGRLVTMADVAPDPDESTAASAASAAEPLAGGQPGLAGTPVGCPPAALDRWRGVAALRPARRVDACDQVLRLLASNDGALPVPPPHTAPRHRNLTASMPGHASLASSGVEAAFRDGRLSFLSFSGADPALIESARSSVISRDGQLPFEPVSAFAFDGGLREVLELRGGGMSLAIDYLIASAGALVLQLSLSCETEPPSMIRVVPFAFSLPIPVTASPGIVVTSSWPRSATRTAALADGDVAAGLALTLANAESQKLCLARLDGRGQEPCLVRLESAESPSWIERRRSLRPGRARARGRAARGSAAELQLMPSDDRAAGQYAGRTITFTVALSGRPLSAIELLQARGEAEAYAVEGTSRPE